jgi:hypothetical protein
MGKICRAIAASIGLIVFSQTASAALEHRVAENDATSTAAILRDFSITLDSSGSGLDPGKAGIGLVAQASEPAKPATVPTVDSKAPPEPSPPANAPPPPTSTTEVVKPPATATRCALRFMAAEVAGKLKGRKWKEFRQEECGESNVDVVFPTTIAPKYSGTDPDKARMHTCADQFTANKATKANGGLKWIEKNGGYYSECVSRLKG